MCACLLKAAEDKNAPNLIPVKHTENKTIQPLKRLLNGGLLF